MPFAAGGGVDAYARLIAEKLRTTHGATVLVDNRPGASGTIGGVVVHEAEPDGTTLLFSAGTHVMAQHVLKSAPYDPLEAFTPVARVGEAPMLLVMAPDAGPANLAELLVSAKEAPDDWIFGTAALGAPGHLATVAFTQLAGLDLTVIPYAGTAPALNDVAGGHIQLMIDPILALLPMAQTGQVKALAVTSEKRTRLAPDIPSAAEAGLPGLEMSSWYGIWAPKGFSAEATATLNKAINGAVEALGNEGRLDKLGIEPVAETPQEFDAFARAYAARGAELLKAAHYEAI